MGLLKKPKAAARWEEGGGEGSRRGSGRRRGRRAEEVGYTLSTLQLH